MTIASAFEQQMLSLLNQDRAAVGLGALQFNHKLNTAAERHSRWMLDTDIFSHTGINQTSPQDRAAGVGYVFSGSWGVAENIGVQTERGAAGIADDVADLHRGLMNSPGHRANILTGAFDEVGIGIETGTFTFEGVAYTSVIVTQNFAYSAADNGGPTGPTPRPPVVNGVGNDAANRILGTGASEKLDGRGGNDTLGGRDGDDVLLGRAGNDSLSGGTGKDTLYGGDQDDRLSGGADNDRLDGGAQDDRLEGGPGDDRQTGGAGSDVFVFAQRIDRDRITDFGDDQDTILFGTGPWNEALTVQAFVDSYARSVGADVVFNFGLGQRLVVSNVASIAQLYDDVLLIG